ncbi:MAG: SDR family oxidoreductase [Sneathiella sp.]
MTPYLFCFGLGFTATEVVSQLPCWDVGGTQRHPVQESEKTVRQISLKQFDGQSPAQNLDGLSKKITHILLSVPPGDQGDPVYNLMGEWISDLPNLQWVGYLSTTGVYGNLNGATATEDTPCNPSGLRGSRRMKAEQDWLDLYDKKGIPIHIFRLPGIYGPGRNQLVSVKTGKAHRIVKKDHVFSRIHVEDLAQIITASMKAPKPGQIYNVSDDEAAPPQDVVTYAAKLLNVDPPAFQDFEAADISAMARSFYSDNKRVSNERIKTELGVSLRYPTYKQGLDALFKNM